MVSPLPKSILDGRLLTESKMSHGMSKPPLGRVRHQQLTPVQPSITECFCTGILHQKAAENQCATYYAK
ncbi:MAG: hypothetical protein WCB09_06030, partial [Methylocella sp.]